MFFKKKHSKKLVNILIIDDKQLSIDNAKTAIKQFINNCGNANIDFKLHSFLRVSDFYVSKTKFDIAIIDWNIGETIGEKGDKVYYKIKGDCSHFCICSGQEKDISEISIFAIEHGGTYIPKGSNVDIKLQKWFERGLIKMGLIDDNK